ncbi:MAG: type II secretion system F family protein [Myxococcales bacterium]|nr:type II secretion system F family protein [Myxococcales bacterium]
MAEFVYEAKTRTGEMRKGVMEAETPAAVEARLRAQNFSPVKVKKKPRAINFSFGSPVSSKELVVFTRQFATMIDAGLPIVQCLDILASQGDNKLFAGIIRDIKGQVEQGSTFSEALRRHPKVFDSLYVNLVAAGELGGIMDTILNRLAIYIEKRVKLQRQVRGAMVYPIGVMTIAVVVLSILLIWVIPTFEAMFKDFGAEEALPGLTRFVINMSHGVVHNLVWIVLVVGGVISGVSYSYKTTIGKNFWHRLVLTMPVLGPVMRKIAVARFTRTMGTLLSSGVPILEAMNIVGQSAGNIVIEKAIADTMERVKEGSTVAEPLMATKVFPSMVVQMIGVGEETGALDQMLNKIADFYEEEVDIAVSAMTSLLEPLMMVVIGGMVGFMLIAMYLPIFNIAGAIKTE